jgi:hypothetical protein
LELDHRQKVLRIVEIGECSELHEYVASFEAQWKSDLRAGGDTGAIGASTVVVAEGVAGVRPARMPIASGNNASTSTRALPSMI